jgi:hypothetical protein
LKHAESNPKAISDRLLSTPSKSRKTTFMLFYRTLFENDQ